MDIDSHSWVLWLGVIAVALHVIEEYSEGWVTWANFDPGGRFGITITEKDFFLGSTGLDLHRPRRCGDRLVGSRD